MQDLINSTKNMVIFYKVAIARFVLFVIVTMGTAITGALTGTKWDQIDHQTKFLIIVAIVVNVSSTVMAFLDKTLARLAQADDNPSNLAKSQTATPFSSGPSKPPVSQI